MTPETSTIGADLLLLHLRRHRRLVRLLQPRSADSHTRNSTSVAETQLLLLAVLLLRCIDLQSSLLLTNGQAVRQQGIRMKAANLTVHHAHPELGILRLLL
jgi:hypothetical protein